MSNTDEGLAFVLPDLVDGADVGVVEGRGGPSFATEALQRLRIPGNLLRQELEGDKKAWVSPVLICKATPAICPRSLLGGGSALVAVRCLQALYVDLFHLEHGLHHPC
jgi:hypothetical protein